MPEYENETIPARETPVSLEWPSLIDAASVPGHASDRAIANQRRAQWVAQLRQAASQEGAYLVPLRLFIGLGWLRAGAEKIVDQGWRDGASLAAFLHHHLSSGDVSFPWYQTLIQQVFLPHAALLALLIVLGQLLTGVAIAAGGLTNAALLGGLFMNLNFLLAGAPNPSAFYIVIQIALLLSNAGAIFGVDAILAKTKHNPLLVAQPPGACRQLRGRRSMPALAAISMLTMVYALAHVTDWSPAGSVEDPAMLVAILAQLSLAWMAIAWLRQDGRRRQGARRHLTRSRPRRPLGLSVDKAVAPIRQIGAAIAARSGVGLRLARWIRSPRQPRRLALTLSVAWADDPSVGGAREGD